VSDYKWKIIMLGDFAVGKTSLVQRFVTNTFSEDYLTTIGVRVMKKEVALEGRPPVTLLVWDIAGSDSFSRVSPEYVRGASFGIIVGDATRRPTVEALKEHAELFRSVNPDAGRIIALNKADLLDEGGADPGKLGLADELENDTILFTSAKDGRNVDEMFLHAARELLGKLG